MLVLVLHCPVAVVYTPLVRFVVNCCSVAAKHRSDKALLLIKFYLFIDTDQRHSRAWMSAQLQQYV